MGVALGTALGTKVGNRVGDNVGASVGWPVWPGGSTVAVVPPAIAAVVVPPVTAAVVAAGVPPMAVVPPATVVPAAVVVPTLVVAAAGAAVGGWVWGAGVAIGPGVVAGATAPAHAEEAAGEDTGIRLPPFRQLLASSHSNKGMSTYVNPLLAPNSFFPRLSFTAYWYWFLGYPSTDMVRSFSTINELLRDTMSTDVPDTCGFDAAGLVAYFEILDSPFHRSAAMSQLNSMFALWFARSAVFQ